MERAARISRVSSSFPYGPTSFSIGSAGWTLASRFRRRVFNRAAAPVPGVESWAAAINEVVIVYFQQVSRHHFKIQRLWRMIQARYLSISSSIVCSMVLLRGPSNIPS